MAHAEDDQQKAFQALQKALNVRNSDEWERMVLYKEITRRLFEKEPKVAMEILKEIEQ